MWQCSEAMTHLLLSARILSKNMKNACVKPGFSLSPKCLSPLCVVVVVELLLRIHTSLACPPVRESISGSVWPELVFGEPGRGSGGSGGRWKQWTKKKKKEKGKEKNEDKIWKTKEKMLTI